MVFILEPKNTRKSIHAVNTKNINSGTIGQDQFITDLLMLYITNNQRKRCTGYSCIQSFPLGMAIIVTTQDNQIYKVPQRQQSK